MKGYMSIALCLLFHANYAWMLAPSDQEPTMGQEQHMCNRADTFSGSPRSSQDQARDEDGKGDLVNDDTERFCKEMLRREPECKSYFKHDLKIQFKPNTLVGKIAKNFIAVGFLQYLVTFILLAVLVFAVGFVCIFCTKGVEAPASGERSASSNITRAYLEAFDYDYEATSPPDFEDGDG